MVLTIFKPSGSTVPPLSSRAMLQPADHNVKTNVSTQWMTATRLNEIQWLCLVMLLVDCIATVVLVSSVFGEKSR